jgi:hypothetical protein
VTSKYFLYKQLFSRGMHAWYTFGPMKHSDFSGLVSEERIWTDCQWDDNIETVALEHFLTINKEEALGRPILYSN